jgi:two-component system KDP operon response regulator KdpE
MKVLVVDDDPDIVDAVSVALSFHWREIEVLTADSGEHALEAFYEHSPEIVLLDVNMLGRSGFEVLQEIRRLSDVPLLMLTGRAAETDQVRGLNLGADDYVVKPFSAMTLLARIQSVLRRANLRTATGRAADFTAGDLEIDFDAQEVRVRGEVVSLTPAEYKLLTHLARNAGRLMPHRALLERVWGPDWGATSSNLKALVSRLRSKLETGGSRYIESERGMGYRFVRPSAPAATEDRAEATR